MENINNKVFSLHPIDELIDIVRNDFRKFSAEGLIDEGTLVKTVLACNNKLGLFVREIREIAIPVNDFKATLPIDFEKVYYLCALNCSNTSISTGLRNPFDNNFDSDIATTYKACVKNNTLGCIDNCQIVIERDGLPVTLYHNQWIELSTSGPDHFFHMDCPNRRRRGKYEVEIKDGIVHTPFKSGTLYMMYVGLMRDEEGKITFPFHPLITPYYEWMIKEKILCDAIFNSDGPNLGELYKLAQQERVKAWLDAYNFSSDRGFGEFQKEQRKRELAWYTQYFRYFQ